MASDLKAGREHSGTFDEDAAMCRCGHSYFHHAGQAFNYSCCSCDCASFAEGNDLHPPTQPTQENGT